MIAFPLMMLACAAVAGLGVPIVIFGTLFINFFPYGLFFLSYCAAGAALIAYTISLPYHAHSLLKKSKQNWMLPIA
jgi:hypothetical protein